jgi:carboxypeptidase PM20D1
VTDESALERFRTLLRIPTISRANESTTDWTHFQRFVDALPQLYPALHSTLTRELVDGYSMVYRWSGTSDDEPAVLMAHYDVVAAGDDGWQHPPFGAELVEKPSGTEIWGRGTLDDKGALVAILEAVEAMVLEGHRPQRDVYLCFGHNEETAGSGARRIVDLLEERGIRPGFVLDEGGAVVERIFPGVSAPSAVVGVSEKGLMSVDLSVAQVGGHASTPPRLSAPARLARAIVRLGKRPFPAKLGSTNLEMIQTLGQHARQPYRLLFTRTRLTRPLLVVLFGRLSDETSAMVRTTQVTTELSGSLAANAMAETARATLNVRIAVGSSVEATLRHIRRAIRDPKVSISALHPSEPSPVSPTSGAAWDTLGASITTAYPGVIVTPYIMLAASDGRHFTRISDHVYRFSPFEMSAEERGTLHAVNERIRVATFLQGIVFYRTLVAAL